MLGHMDVFANGLTIKFQGSFDPFDGVRLMPVIDDFHNFIHAYMPPCHSPFSPRLILTSGDYGNLELTYASLRQAGGEQPWS